MDRIIVENVRCFRERQEVPLAPLTILVGENSSGKSTFLALTRLAWDLASVPASGRRVSLNFNEEPFLLGAYDQIATLSSFAEAVPSFMLGAEITLSEQSSPVTGLVTITGRFTSHRGQPALMDWVLESPSYRLEITYRTGGDVAVLRVRTPSGEIEVDGDDLPSSPMGLILHWATSALAWLVSSGEIEDARLTSEDVRAIELMSYDLILAFRSRPYAFAPIRTRPQRTYDPIKEINDPEGSHVPMLLASTSTEGGQAWEELKRSLDEFGRQSGLFDGIKVRRLGKGEGDPFQIQVDLGGAMTNLMDVGYGVSQALPLVVDCLRKGSGDTFLLQQPEVHLHPKAQAEMATFLGALAKLRNKSFLIETHSDYIIDRIRMDVRDRRSGLQPEDVALLYFERKGKDVQIHHLYFDELGNLLGGGRNPGALPVQ